MSNPSIVIASAARTAVGSFNGAFGNTPAHELGAAAIKAVLERAGVEAGEVDEVILGQVLPAGEGQNPARQAAMKAGLPQEKTAWGMNQLCGSGLRAVALGMQQIATGDAKVIVAGGMESMSMAPHCAHLRGGVKMGDYKMIDTMIKDGLTDAFYGYHMGITAENVARKWQLTREEQDEFALASQNKRKRPRRPAFRRRDRAFRREDAQGRRKRGSGRVHPPRCHAGFDRKAPPGLRQGRYRDRGQRFGSQRRCRRGALDDRGRGGPARHPAACPHRLLGHGRRRPAIMGTGPIPASRKALEKAGWSVADIELVEANEAFAAQACAVNKDLGWDPSIVNVNGGAIAIGHPIGASGARVLNTLLFEMKRRGVSKGLATLCIGGGMGVAMCVERL